MNYRVIELDLTAARANEQVAVDAWALAFLRVPDGANLTMRIGATAAAAVPVGEGAPRSFTFDEYVENIFLTHDAVADGTLYILASDDVCAEFGGSGAAASIRTDASGNQYVRLADRLDSAMDSITIVTGTDPAEVESVDGRSDWGVAANADNGVATATRAAVVGSQHYATAVIVGYTDAATSGTYRLTIGGAAVLEGVVHGSAVIALPAPYVGNEGEALAVDLDASGTPGTLGYVSLLGYTRVA